MPLVDDCFKSTGLKPSDMDAFATVSGPGSFTGLRIGLATVQGLAYSEKKPCIALNTMDVLAHNIIHFDGLIVPLIDARNAQAYSAVYDGMARYKKIIADMAKLVADIAKEVKQHQRKTLFLGDGALINRDTLSDIMGEYALFAPAYLNNQTAQTAAFLAQIKYDKRKTITPNELVPYYFRASSAKKIKL